MKIKESEKFIRDKLEELHKVTDQYILFFQTNQDFINHLKHKYNINEKFLSDLQKRADDIYKNVSTLKTISKENFFDELRQFLFHNYSVFIDLLKMLFYQIIFYTNKQNIMELIASSDNPAFDFIGGNYLLLTMNFKKIKNAINQFYFKDIKLKDELIIDNNTELWLVSDMEHDIFPSDINKIVEYTETVIKPTSGKISSDDFQVLHHEVSELIINAIKHGNKNDVNKIIRLWYKFQDDCYKFIIEDQGEGFKDLEKWNEFNRERNRAIQIKNIKLMEKFALYRPEGSDNTKGGSTFFGALQYWDSGVIFNSKRNKIVTMKYFYSE